MKLGRSLLIFVSFSTLASAFEYDIEYPDDWIDPSDMLNFKQENVAKPEPQEQKEPESSKDTKDEVDKVPKNDPPPTEVSEQNIIKEKANKKFPGEVLNDGSECNNLHMKRFLSVFLRKLSNVGEPPYVNHFDMSVHIDSQKWKVMSKYAEDCGINIAEVTNILETIINDVRHPPKIRENRLKMKLQDILPMAFEDIVKGLILVLIIVASLTLEGFSRISWMTQLRRLVVIAFLISIPQTYYHELKLAEAEHKSKPINIPEECREDHTPSVFEAVGTTFRYYLSVNKDRCSEYHANNLISPFMKITPTKVIAVTLTRFAVEPMEHIGTAFSRSFKNIFQGLPVTLWIPAFLFVLLVIVGFLLIIAVFFGYNFSFNLPFWAGIQMGPQQNLPNPQVDQMIEDQRRHIQQLCDTIQDLRTRPQQALPAPPVARPSRIGNVMQYLGFRNPNPPANQDPPNLPQCPYPNFNEPKMRHEPQRREENMGDFEPPSYGDAIRRRNPRRPHSASESGEGSSRAPSSRVVHSDPIQIGFEHLVVDRDREAGDGNGINHAKVSKLQTFNASKDSDTRLKSPEAVEDVEIFKSKNESKKKLEDDVKDKTVNGFDEPGSKPEFEEEKCAIDSTGELDTREKQCTAAAVEEIPAETAVFSQTQIKKTEVLDEENEDVGSPCKDFYEEHQLLDDLKMEAEGGISLPMST